MKRITIAIAVGLGLFASSGMSEELESFVPRPLTQLEKSNIRAAVQRRLTDPKSAEFRWNPEIRRTAFYCGFVNSKNRMGGYAGFTLFVALLDNDRNVASLEVHSDPKSAMAYVNVKMCQEYGYNLDPASDDLVED